MEWHAAIAMIRPYIVRVSTPGGSGTGFLAAAKPRLGVELQGREAIIHGRGEAEPRGIGLTGRRFCRRL